MSALVPLLIFYAVFFIVGKIYKPAKSGKPAEGRKSSEPIPSMWSKESRKDEEAVPSLWSKESRKDAESVSSLWSKDSGEGDDCEYGEVNHDFSHDSEHRVRQLKGYLDAGLIDKKEYAQMLERYTLQDEVYRTYQDL